MDGSTRAAPWAVVAAYAVPLCVLPSAVWRSWLFVNGTVGLDAEGLYLLTLTVASVGLALLTLGLVRPWGERVPRWVPVLGGRPIAVRAVVMPALSGALLLIGLSAFIVLDEVFHLVGPGPVLIGPSGPDVPSHPPPDGRVMALYLPMLLWGPLLLVLSIDYRRRRARTDRPLGPDIVAARDRSYGTNRISGKRGDGPSNKWSSRPRNHRSKNETT